VELEEELKKVNKKAIYPLATAHMLLKNETVQKGLKKKNLTIEKVESMRQSVTSFAELFEQLS
jgi:hypothetical protein